MSAKKPRKPVRRPSRPQTHTQPKPSMRTWWNRLDKRKLAIVLAITAAVGVVAFFPIALVTDQPSFCKSCHGMQPFYDAWRTGKHKDVWCVDCHVNAGYPSRFLHKFAALKEVYDQFFASPTYPAYDADVTNDRCLRCHSDVPKRVAGVGQFSHQMHLSRGVACATCHADAGHHVTFAALEGAGVLNTNQITPGATYVGQQFTGAPGKHSALPGHKPVPCSNCHDQANLQCSFCHTPPANHFGADCRLCHRPGVPFQNFTHPPSGEHSYLSRPCVKCHPNNYTTVFCTCHGGHPPKGD